jgi:hypothetical protein
LSAARHFTVCSAATQNDQLLLHLRRLVRPCEQLFAQPWPALAQVRWQLIHRHPVDAGLPLFFLTRFSAARRFGRSHTFSIRPIAPKRSFSRVAGGAPSPRFPVGVSPVFENGSSSCLVI